MSNLNILKTITAFDRMGPIIFRKNLNEPSNLTVINRVEIITYIDTVSSPTSKLFSVNFYLGSNKIHSYGCGEYCGSNLSTIYASIKKQII
jgi:hypothetical protein